jgi:hypothetical protein
MQETRSGYASGMSEIAFEMTFSELKAELARYSFMPGWSFRVELDFMGGWLVTTATVMDSRQPDQMTTVTSRTHIPSHLPREMLSHWMLITVEGLMIHEGREWLKRDGTLISDPHGAD